MTLSEQLDQNERQIKELTNRWLRDEINDQEYEPEHDRLYAERLRLRTAVSEQRHDERIRQLVTAKVLSAVDGDQQSRVRVDVSGPGWVAGPAPGDKPKQQADWTVMVSLAQDGATPWPTAAWIPLTGVLPSDATFEEAGLYLINECLEMAARNV